MYQRILVPTDGSTLSKKAVTCAVDLAAITGAELVALYVVPRYPVSYFEGNISIPDSEIARTEKQWTDKGQAVVDAGEKTAKAKGRKVKGVLARSDLVAESVISAAQEHKCNRTGKARHVRQGTKPERPGAETPPLRKQAAGDGLVFTDQPEKNVFGRNYGRAVLQCLVSGKENDASGTF